MYRTYQNRTILSEEGREFKKSMSDHLQNMSHIRKLSEPIRISVVFSFKDNRRRDVDNYIKSLLDSLNGVLFNDDSQIMELHLYKVMCSKKEGIQLECSCI